MDRVIESAAGAVAEISSAWRRGASFFESAASLGVICGAEVYTAGLDAMQLRPRSR